MKSTIPKKTYLAIYRLLNRVSPIEGDCGRLCGSVCCTCSEAESSSDGFSLGIYLLPGEDRVFSKAEDWLEWSYTKVSEGDFPDSWSGIAYFIRCKTPPHCHREKRPLQCRVFPLAPHITASGELRMILFPTGSLPYRCPLTENEMPLSSAFVKATRTVWKRLIRDELIYDLVKFDSKYRSKRRLVFVD